jgi:exportin-1
MITANFEDYPDHRINFFKFLRACNSHCFEALFSIPPEHQKLVRNDDLLAFSFVTFESVALGSGLHRMGL